MHRPKKSPLGDLGGDVGDAYAPAKKSPLGDLGGIDV